MPGAGLTSRRSGRHRLTCWPYRTWENPRNGILEGTMGPGSAPSSYSTQLAKPARPAGYRFEYEYPPFRYPRRDPKKSQYREYIEETIKGHRVWRGFSFERYEIDV